jgi:hypothetical protein
MCTGFRGGLFGRRRWGARCEREDESIGSRRKLTEFEGRITL